jgi:hypothetical protein
MFSTPVAIAPPDFLLLPHSRVLSVGSCFAEHIGQRLIAGKMPVLNNPFGTIFNPVSIARLLQWCTEEGQLPESGFVQSEGVWKHLDLHSAYWHADKEALVQQLNALQAQVGAFVRQTDIIMITLGTAWVYEYQATGEVVANCHKLPAKQFSKRLLSVAEVVNSLQAIKAMLPATANMILTVSPVRHIKDTLPLNAVSKSVLRLACHELAQEGAYYFPAYEIVTDELRDYRFYEADMLHPSKVAIDYVWKQFRASCFSPAADARLSQWEKIQRDLQHRPLQPHTEAHRRFLMALLQKLEQLKADADITAEVALIQQQLQ